MDLTLYYAPIACSLVPYVALKEADAQFAVRLVNFRNSTHLTEEYLSINPKHAVPVLVVDGKPLTENVAILQWVAETYPSAQLLPDSGMEKYRANCVLSLVRLWHTSVPYSQRAA